MANKKTKELGVTVRYDSGTFFQVPNKQIILGQSTKTIALYAVICSHSNNLGECWPSRSLLAKESSMSVKAVDKHMKELCDIGLIRKIKQKRADGCNMTNRYILVQFATPSGKGYDELCIMDEDKTDNESKLYPRVGMKLAPIVGIKNDPLTILRELKEENTSAHTGAETAEHTETALHKKQKDQPNRSPTPSADQDCSIPLLERVSPTTQPPAPPQLQEPEEFDLDVYVSEKLLCPTSTVPNKIIGLFLQRKRQEYNLPDLRTKKQVESLMPRWHKAVKSLVDGEYVRDQISEAIDRALSNVKEETALETIIKYIGK